MLHFLLAPTLMGTTTLLFVLEAKLQTFTVSRSTQYYSKKRDWSDKVNLVHVCHKTNNNVLLLIDTGVPMEMRLLIAIIK